jgi:hypothetical protein
LADSFLLKSVCFHPADRARTRMPLPSRYALESPPGHRPCWDCGRLVVRRQPCEPDEGDSRLRGFILKCAKLLELRGRHGCSIGKWLPRVLSDTHSHQFRNFRAIWRRVRAESLLCPFFRPPSPLIHTKSQLQSQQTVTKVQGSNQSPVVEHKGLSAVLLFNRQFLILFEAVTMAADFDLAAAA